MITAISEDTMWWTESVKSFENKKMEARVRKDLDSVWGLEWTWGSPRKQTNKQEAENVI